MNTLGDVSVQSQCREYGTGVHSESTASYQHNSLVHSEVRSRSPSPSRIRLITNPWIFLRYLCRLTGRLLYLLVPSFLHRTLPAEEVKSDLLPPTAFLDGVRGLAAFAVFMCHLTYTTFDITHGYGAQPSVSKSLLPDSAPPSEYVSFLRLPIVRLVYSGPPMVAIFFVISGFALSYKPIRLMRTGSHEAFSLAMTSSVFRRGLRLFLPCFASTFLVACMAQLNLYEATRPFAKNMRIISEMHIWTAPTPTAQFIDWARKMYNFVNVFDWKIFAGATDLDSHLWTIPAEFRCSLALFLTHLLVARLSARSRTCILAALIVWGVSWDKWDMCPFWAGAIIAETDLSKISARNTIIPAVVEKDVASIQGGDKPVEKQGTPARKRANLFYWLVFSVALFLLSYPDAAGHATPGYVTLTKLIPKDFSQKHRFWPTIGAGLIVWSINNLKVLRSGVFCWAPIQYLGKISFPLYVMHGPVIHTLGYRIMPTPPKVESPEELSRFEIEFFQAAVATVVVVIWVADIFWRAVDIPCVKLTRFIEKILFLE